MPIYEYYCEPCKVQLEELQPINKMKKSIPCPECGGRMRRIMSLPGHVEGNYTPKFYGKD